MIDPVWHPEALGALLPRRGAKKRVVRRDTKRLEAAMRALLDGQAGRFRAGLADAAPAGRELASAAISHAEALVADPSLTLVPALYGALLTMADDPRVDIAPAMLGAIFSGPLADALRTLVATVTICSDRVGALDLKTINSAPLVLTLDPPAPTIAYQRWRRREEWETLRAVLAGADDADYRAAKAVAAELRGQVPEVVRCAIDYAFPDEPAWAKEDAIVYLDTAPARKVTYANSPRTSQYGALLLASLDDAEVACRLLDFVIDHRWFDQAGFHGLEVVRAAGARALAPLSKALAITEGRPDDWKDWAADLRRIAAAAALFPGDAVSAALLPLIDHKTIGAEVADYFTRNPREAARTLGPRLLESSRKATRATEILSMMARVDSAALSAASADVEPKVKAAIAKLLGATSLASARQEASGDEIPEILRTPPWRSKAPRATAAGVTTVPTMPYVESVDASALAPPPEWMGSDIGPLTASELDAFEKKLATSLGRTDHKRSAFDGVFIHVHRLQAPRLLTIWNETPAWAWHAPDWASDYMLRHHGEKAIGGVVALAEAGEVPALRALAACDTPRAARAMAQASRRRASRVVVTRWLGKFPRAAATGLLPIALGPLGRERDQGGECLRWLVSNGHGDVVRDVAKVHGVEAAVDQVLAFDPRLSCPAKPPKLSTFFVAEGLPRLALKSGNLLPLEQTGILGEMLQFSPIDPPYVGLAEVKQALEQRSLDEFLWALLGAWVQAGGASANAWAMFAMGHLGGDESVRRLAPAIKRWPREKARPRALMGLDVLGMIGTDVALMHLADLAEKGKNAHVEAHAKELLAQVAEARGLDEEALGDRLIPDLGLDQGKCTLDYGSRTFEVRFSPELEPVLFDEGKPIKTLPRASKDDDAEQAKVAQATWKALKDDAKSVTASLRLRLERAMCDGRSWEAASFRALMIEHPLTQLATRRLVWATVDEAGAVVATFRVAEDDTLAGVDDAPFTLGDDDQVALPHPLKLDEATRARWSTVISDYEILQPFPQIGREMPTAPAGAQGNQLPGLPDREIPYHVLTGALEARGWKRVVSGDIEGGSNSYEKRVAGCLVSLSYSPPSYFRQPPPERVTIGGVYFDAPIAQLSAIAYGEIARDIGVFGLK